MNITLTENVELMTSFYWHYVTNRQLLISNQ